MDNHCAAACWYCPAASRRAPWRPVRGSWPIIGWRCWRDRCGTGSATAWRSGWCSTGLRGWNGAQFDALRDAQVALDDMREEFDPAKIVVVGHSMGGPGGGAPCGERRRRRRCRAGAVVATKRCRSRADQLPAARAARHRRPRTDPGASRAQTRHARERGVDAQWVPMAGAGHSMIRDWRRWHRLTAEFAAAQLAETLPEP